MQVYYQTPINEQFEASYNQRGLQPSTGGVAPIRTVQVERKNDPKARRGGKQNIRNIQTTGKQATGYTMQAAGAGMQAGGKAVKAGGRGAMQAGAALSSTGVGAVAGVPLAVAGAGATAVGTGVDAAGKATRKAGKKISQTKRTTKIASTAAKTATPLGLLSLLWPLWIYFFVQLPFAVFSIIFFGLSYLVHQMFLLTPDEDERTDPLTGAITSAFNWLVSQAKEHLGINLEILNPVSILMMCMYITLAVGLFTLTILAVKMTLQGKAVFLGTASWLKFVAFGAALLFYTFPFTSLLPAYLGWQWVVGKFSDDD